MVNRFFSNRRKDVITTTLQSYKGCNLIDLRKFVANREGISVPTSKGITVKVARLHDLKKAIDAAVIKATELGLLDDSEAE
ncbi:PC4/YdbC family ssDNA-binding protein [Nitrobacter vulgaris]|uniref:PC4/YdbC family ssDNA-binding protein n=1 Tax=Nitrobacter vulgaris TaxID=29421 RepID=UPI001301CA7C|nr:PC4/YdbC family ssDNA-binding protein [Nitrobacter vulgaris]